MKDQAKRITATELAQLSGYSPTTITRLTAAGVLQRDNRRRYDPLSSLKQIQQHESNRQHAGKREGMEYTATAEREADPVGFAIRVAVEGLHEIMDWHRHFRGQCLLAIAGLDGHCKHLPAETRRLIKRAMAATLAIDEATWAAVVPWHELDMATIRTGTLAQKYEIATSPEDDDATSAPDHSPE